VRNSQQSSGKDGSDGWDSSANDDHANYEFEEDEELKQEEEDFFNQLQERENLLKQKQIKGFDKSSSERKREEE
jgi:hypothetical protein